MLAKCRRGQWDPDDLDWSATPRSLSRADEEALVQYFTDMSGIELLAGELFAAQRDMTDDPLLSEILDTFVIDERRHSIVAWRLARHFDVHRYREYRVNPHLEAFRPHFVAAIQAFSPEVANTYITVGELILDIALLRSIDDFAADETCAAAMRLINRDESRHIAIDFHMADYYSSPEFDAILEARPGKPWRDELAAWRSFALLFRYGSPFFRAVFFEPMDRIDPDRKRMKACWRHIQVVASKPRIARRPFVAFMRRLQDLFAHPTLGRFFAPLVVALLGVPDWAIRPMITVEEEAHARATSLDDLAQEALRLKIESRGFA